MKVTVTYLNEKLTVEGVYFDSSDGLPEAVESYSIIKDNIEVIDNYDPHQLCEIEILCLKQIKKDNYEF
tara:strand:- start:356 stop:562 length:207 start_codon:yes stop_codon:yes gene_type:complete